MPRASGHSGQPSRDLPAPLKVPEATGGPTVPERLTSPPCCWARNGHPGHRAPAAPHCVPAGPPGANTDAWKRFSKGVQPEAASPSLPWSQRSPEPLLPPSFPPVGSHRQVLLWGSGPAPGALGSDGTRGRKEPGPRSSRSGIARPPVRPPRGANPAPRPRPAALPSTLVRVSTGLLQALRGATLAECFFMASPSPAAAPRRPAPTSWRRRSPPGRRSRHGPAAARRLPARRPLPQHRAAAAAGAGARPPARRRSGLLQTTRHGAARSPRRSRGRPRVEGGRGRSGEGSGGAPTGRGGVRAHCGCGQRSRSGPAPRRPGSAAGASRRLRGSAQPTSGETSKPLLFARISSLPHLPSKPSPVPILCRFPPSFSLLFLLEERARN